VSPLERTIARGIVASGLYAEGDDDVAHLAASVAVVVWPLLSAEQQALVPEAVRDRT
jgi:hypothetical protein